ncbi:MAG: sigma-54-dependent transcriptional regulator, partial [Bacteriovoracia bacterium]
MTEILVVDDDEVTRNLLQEVFLKEGYRVTLAVSGEAALKQIAKQEFPLVLSDIRMLELDGMGLLAAVKQKGHRSVVVLMTGFGSMETAVEAVQKGAFDYVSKPFRIEDLKAVIARAAKHWSTVMSPAKSGAKVPAVPFSTKVFIGRSPQIVEVYKILARATISDSSVLITGESGTGKELIARAIYQHSHRLGECFMAVNCAALTESLLESELFG